MPTQLYLTVVLKWLQIFDLSDLYGFSLFLRAGFYNVHAGLFFEGMSCAQVFYFSSFQ